MEGPVAATGWTVETAYEHATARAIPPSTPGGDHQYFCPFSGCNKPFTKRFNLKAHLRVHTGDRPFVCSFAGCDRRFMWKSSLTSHEVGHSRRDAENDRRPPLGSRSRRRTRTGHYSNPNAAAVAATAAVNASRMNSQQLPMYVDPNTVTAAPNGGSFIAPGVDMYAHAHAQYAQHNAKVQKVDHKMFHHPPVSMPLHNANPISTVPTSNVSMVPQPPLHPEFPPPETKPVQTESTGLTPLFGSRGAADSFLNTTTNTDNHNQQSHFSSAPLPAPSVSAPINKLPDASLPLVYTSNGQRTLTPPVPSTAGVSPGTWFGSNYLPAPQGSASWLNTGSGGVSGTLPPPPIKTEPSKFNAESNVLPPPVNAESAATSPQPVGSATVSPVPPPMLPQVSASSSRPRRPPKAPGLASGTLLPPIANMPAVNPPSHINLAGIGIVDVDHTEMTPNLQAQHNSTSPLPIESPIHGFSPMPISPLQPFSPSILFKTGYQSQNW